MKAQWLSVLAFDMLNASKGTLRKRFHSPGLQDNSPPEKSGKSALSLKANQCPFWCGFFCVIILCLFLDNQPQAKGEEECKEAFHVSV